MRLAPALLLVWICTPSCRPAPRSEPGESSPRAAADIRPVPFTRVRLTDDFWRPRLETNRTVTIPHIMKQNEETGRVDNFRKATGALPGSYQGRRFNDTDLYKVIEAASYTLAQDPDPALDAELDELIALIAESQEDDGYLFPARTVDPTRPAPGVGSERWIHVAAGSHELYNAGHLIEAAVAHYQATGKSSLLKVAVRFADRIDEDFGADGRRDIPGHEEIELALVKLAEVTAEERYLELAKFFIDERGREHASLPYPSDTDFAIYNDRGYQQDHLPVVAQEKARGHAVRATYLYTGMTDVASRMEAPGYRQALESIWTDLVSTKLYLTGGIGARGTFESFGEDYELPNASAYAETCAAVGNDLWNHRLFLMSGEARYLDVMERILYNGALSGVALEGNRFFYTNPLASDGEAQRSSYFEVACCPANLARLLARLPGFVYAQRGDELFVNLFVGSEASVELDSGSLGILQETRYPWDGSLRLTLSPDRPMVLELHLRIPGWAREEPVESDLYRFADTSDASITLKLNGEPIPHAFGTGFATIERRWERGDVLELELPMPVRRVSSHGSVEDNRGKLAIQRGPLVYAAEAIDNGGRLSDLTLPLDAELEVEFLDDLLGGVAVVRGKGKRGEDDAPFFAVPYFAWANRGPGEMVVWIPVHERSWDR